MKKTMLLVLFLIAAGYVNSQIKVKLLLPNNCNTTTEIKTSDNEQNSRLELFPNPSDGSFSLNIGFKTIIEKAVIRIFNTSGQEIYSETVFSNSDKLVKQLRLQNFASGTYIISVKNDKQEISTKLIIK